jgi:hypothetical protein
MTAPPSSPSPISIAPEAGVGALGLAAPLERRQRLQVDPRRGIAPAVEEHAVEVVRRRLVGLGEAARAPLVRLPNRFVDSAGRARNFGRVRALSG